MTTMIILVTVTIATEMIFQIRLKVKKMFTEFGGRKYFRKRLKQCTRKIVTLKKELVYATK